MDKSSTPRISVNKLGEYLEASPTRRRTIVKAQHFPPGEVVVARYTDVLEGLKEYFANPSPSVLHQRVELLGLDKSGSDWARQDRALSADALRICTDLVQLIDWEKSKVIPTPSSIADQFVVIAGVRVSVRPQFLIVDSIDTTHVQGGIKFSFNKSNPLHELGCEHVASVVRYWMQSRFGRSVQPSRCYAVATATKQFVAAPRAYKTRMAGVAAACEEIAIRWRTLDVAEA